MRNSKKLFEAAGQESRWSRQEAAALSEAGESTRHRAGKTSLLAAILVCAASACSHAGTRESLSLVGSLTPQFQPIWSPAGERILQYSQMAWSDNGDQLIASVMQGPRVAVLDVNHHRGQLMAVGDRGGELVVAWIPGINQWVTEALDPAADGASPKRAWYVASDATHAMALGQGRLRPPTVAARGIALSDGRPGFVAIEEAGMRGEAPPLVVRDLTGAELSRVTPFPSDGALRHVVEADFQQHSGRTLMVAAVDTVTRAGGRDPSGKWIEPVSEHDVEVADAFSGKSFCKLTFKDELRDGRRQSFSFQGVALSSDVRKFVVNTPKGALLYDVDTCRQLFALRDERDAEGASGKWIAFSGDGNFVIRDGADVRSRHGGSIDVWRVADGEHVIHEETESHAALAVKAHSTEFAAGRDDGQIDFFRIDIH